MWEYKVWEYERWEYEVLRYQHIFPINRKQDLFLFMHEMCLHTHLMYYRQKMVSKGQMMSRWTIFFFEFYFNICRHTEKAVYESFKKKNNAKKFSKFTWKQIWCSLSLKESPARVLSCCKVFHNNPFEERLRMTASGYSIMFSYSYV